MMRVLPLGILLGALLAAQPSVAQDGGLTHGAYLEAVGLLEDAADMERWLRDELAERRPEWPPEIRNQHAAFFAFVLAVTGATAHALSAVEAQGIDVIHGITADTRPFIEQALLADVVIVGDVVRSDPSADPDDGFGASDAVQVRRVLKGTTPESTVILRRSRTPRDRDVVPVVGERYLLLLSRGMYEFAAARHRGEPTEPPGDHYSVYRIYRMDEEILDWSNFGPDETAQAFEEIQRLDEMLRGAAR